MTARSVRRAENAVDRSVVEPVRPEPDLQCGHVRAACTGGASAKRGARALRESPPTLSSRPASVPLAALHPPKGGIRTRDRIPTTGDAARAYTRDSANQAFSTTRRAPLRLHGHFSQPPARGLFGTGRFLCVSLLAVTAIYGVEALLGVDGRIDAFLRQLGLQRIAGHGVARVPRARPRCEGGAAPLAATRDGARAVDDRRPLLLLRVLPTADVPIPSVADPFYLAFYPVSYVALALLLRRRMQGFRGNLWLDGVIASLAVAAVGAAVAPRRRAPSDDRR